MAKLYIFTQDYENYGDEENPRWKAKGGSDYFVPNFGGVAAITFMLVRGQIESDNAFYKSSILGWEVVSNDYMTEFEQSQLEYEGSIRFPTRVISATK